ncbi:MAG: hypothetical protein KAJ51_02590 [Thermoplasmata archaeon]|nr:hypothetical protein [Thermoplasmata archaeon]
MRARRLIRSWIVLMTVCLILPILIPTAIAGEDAQLDEELNVSASPSQQGTGGLMTITITATFYGGCCYPLYANDVVPEIILPPEVELVSAITPAKLNKFEAIAGGGAAPTSFTFVVKSFTPGEYKIETKVLTSNAGNAEGSVTITVTKGCVITTPILFPQEPATGRSTLITISAYSPIEGVNIENAMLYYLESSNSYKGAKPENGTLYWEGGSKDGNSVAFKLMEFEENQWQSELPKYQEASTVLYWIVAEDNFSNKTTSPLYTIELQDFNEIHFTHNLIIWMAIIGSLLGIIIIATLWGYAHKVPIIHSKSKGILFSGSKALDIKPSGTSDNSYTNKIERTRNFALLAVFIVALILIVIAILTDQYEILRTNVGG